MSEIKITKLQHIMKVSWEAEQMPGWEDSLSKILEETRKEFKIKKKDTELNSTKSELSEEIEHTMEEDFSM